MATNFEDYRDKYKNLRLERTPEGVLTATFHTDGGAHIHNGDAHTQFTHAFGDIAMDDRNEVVILTGARAYSYKKMDFSAVGDITQPEIWHRILTEARRQIHNLLDIDVPVIAVVPGPAHAHGEYAFAGDIVLAAETATFKDEQHLNIGVMPADGVQVLYAEAMGHQRFRAFELLQQTITAGEALRIGMVTEVLPADQLMERAQAIASELLKLPSLARRYTRLMFTKRLKKLANELAFDMGLEGATVIQALRATRPSETDQAAS